MSIKASNNVFPHDPDDNWKLKTDKGGCELTSQQILDRIVEIEAPDEILVRGTVAKTDNKLSIAALAFTCRINQQVLTNNDYFETTIASATDGYHRIDILVFTQYGTILKIQGTEDLVAAQKPPIPDDTLEISFVSVFGSAIDEPQIPDPDGFITKVSKSFIHLDFSGLVDQVTIDDKSWLKLEGTITGLKSLNIPDSANLYHGRDFIFYNATAGNITLYHNQGTGNFKFWFAGGVNIVIKPDESVHIVMRAINYTNNGGLLHYVGLAPNLSNYYTKTETDTALSNKADLVSGKVPSSQLPSYVDDILEGYLLSNVFYLESTHTTVIPAETGKIYIDITTGQKNKEYRYAGSVYIQITNGLIASTDDVIEGATNKYSTLALVMGYLLTGVTFATGTAITASDNILTAFGKIQKQITDNIASIALKQVKDDQVEISTNSNVQNSWHGQTVLFTANCTITVPSALNNSLMFPFRTLAGVTVTWQITSPFTWETTPSTTGEKTVGHFMRRGSTNTIFLDV